MLSDDDIADMVVPRRSGEFGPGNLAGRRPSPANDGPHREDMTTLQDCRRVPDPPDEARQRLTTLPQSFVALPVYALP